MGRYLGHSSPLKPLRAQRDGVGVPFKTQEKTAMRMGGALRGNRSTQCEEAGSLRPASCKEADPAVLPSLPLISCLASPERREQGLLDAVIRRPAAWGEGEQKERSGGTKETTGALQDSGGNGVSTWPSLLTCQLGYWNRRPGFKSRLCLCFQRPASAHCERQPAMDHMPESLRSSL